MKAIEWDVSIAWRLDCVPCTLPESLNLTHCFGDFRLFGCHQSLHHQLSSMVLYLWRERGGGEREMGCCALENAYTQLYFFLRAGWDDRKHDQFVYLLLRRILFFDWFLVCFRHLCRSLFAFLLPVVFSIEYELVRVQRIKLSISHLLWEVRFVPHHCAALSLPWSLPAAFLCILLNTLVAAIHNEIRRGLLLYTANNAERRHLSIFFFPLKISRHF